MIMKILICEDEAPAGRFLRSTIQKLREEAEVLRVVETGEEALEIIKSEKPNLIFLDIELADGSCFETFDKQEINIPIIFATAYDEYALKAFQLNSIEYLVKPISEKDIENALDKFDRIKRSISEGFNFKFSKDFLQKKQYKDRFLVKLGRKLFPIHSDEIAYFVAKEKMVKLITKGGKTFVVNYTLSELEDLLDPLKFFRLNRQFYTHIDSIVELEPYFKGQVVAYLKPETNEEIIVSRSKTPELKDWLD